MRKGKRSTVLPIGLDVGHGGVRLMQVEAVGGDGERRLAVVAAARQSTASGPADPIERLAAGATAGARLMAQHPFVGRRVVVAVPRELVQVKNLRLPMMPVEELAAAARFEAEEAFGFDLDGAAVQVLPAGEVRQGGEVRQEVIVVAARAADVDATVTAVAGAGLEVASLDCEVTALFRGYERFVRRTDDEQDVNVLVDVGVRRTRVVIGRGREVNFYKDIEFGGHHLLEAVGRKLGVTVDEAAALRQRPADEPGAAEQGTVEPGAGERRAGRPDPVRRAVTDATRTVADELATELAMCLRYFTVTFRGHRGVRVRVLGGESADPQLRAAFAGVLGVPVEAGVPLAAVDVARMTAADRAYPAGGWAVAFGLALRLEAGYFAPANGTTRAAAAEWETTGAAAPAAAGGG